MLINRQLIKNSVDWENSFILNLTYKIYIAIIIKVKSHEGVASVLRNKSTYWLSAWLILNCETHVGLMLYMRSIV